MEHLAAAGCRPNDVSIFVNFGSVSQKMLARGQEVAILVLPAVPDPSEDPDKRGKLELVQREQVELDLE